MTQVLTPAAPHHVAIIMDGNGRWAKQRHQPRTFGHKVGKNSVDKVVRAALFAGVKTLSLFAFSTENWTRPKAEVQLIMELIQRSIIEEAGRMKAQGIRMRILGNREGLSDRLNKQIIEAEMLTQDCKRMEVIFALNYSGHWAILDTVKRLAQQVANGELRPEDITELTYNAARPMADLPPVDLLIRSSGEMRISNFHLWESAYAEMYFTDVLWPDFDEAEFTKAIAVYQQRDRRFGGVSNDYPSV